MGNIYRALERARGAGKQDRPADQAPRQLTTPAAAVPGDPYRKPMKQEMSTLAAKIAPLLREREPIIIVVASCSLGAGASTIARELARYCAREGLKVLLAGSEREIGRLASGDAPTTAGAVEIRPSTIAGLDLHILPEVDAPVRTAVPEEQLSRWLAESEDLFNLAIVDVPPLSTHASWTGLLGPNSFVVLVVEADKTRAADMREAARLLAEAEATVLGVVFNKVVERLPAIVTRYLP